MNYSGLSLVIQVALPMAALPTSIIMEPEFTTTCYFGECFGMGILLGWGGRVISVWQGEFPLGSLLNCILGLSSAAPGET